MTGLEERREVVRLYCEHESVSAVERATKLSRERVHQLLAQSSVDTGNRGAARRAEVARAWVEFGTVQGVAQRVGISRRQASILLRRQGVDTRGVSRVKAAGAIARMVEERARIVGDIFSCKSLAQIARRYGISTLTFKRHIYRITGVETVFAVRCLRDDEIRRMYDAGETSAKICAHYTISGSAVRSALLRTGRMRTRSDAQFVRRDRTVGIYRQLYCEAVDAWMREVRTGGAHGSRLHDLLEERYPKRGIVVSIVDAVLGELFDAGEIVSAGRFSTPSQLAFATSMATTAEGLRKLLEFNDGPGWGVGAAAPCGLRSHHRWVPAPVGDR